jgi:trans-2,3-dihydro-3-hydroxyanthranilate isomerase
LNAAIDYRHVDVFTDSAYSGNGLIVFFGGLERSREELQAITTEMRQFESIFVGGHEVEGGVPARIFTAQEELDFAGHPVIGAAAAAHERWFRDEPERSWTFLLGEREIEVWSRRERPFYRAMMNQGRATLEDPLDESTAAGFLPMLGLGSAQRHELPLQVISTGLPYLIVPVTPWGLEKAHVSVSDLESNLLAVGAKFVYVFDPEGREGRTWDNAGEVEDVATGSAAGPSAVYLLEHGLIAGPSFSLRQGRFTGRPSSMAVEVAENSDIWVGGPVAAVASGVLDAGAGARIG